MGLLFKDDLHDEFGTWPLGYIPTGGADYGEVRAVAAAVGDGDDAAFCDAWCAAADRLAAEAAEDEAAGRRASARDGWLRAACFYGAAYHPIFVAPVNPRLLAAFAKQIAAFDRGLALGEPAVTPMGIPLGDLTMPAYLLRAEGRAAATRPLLILTNGYDGTVTDLYFASAVAAARRGYHVLVFDGPGQGGPLYEQGVPLRPDWETVIAAVVDAALELPGIDPRRIALSGWSLGGHLAARAATGEHRLAALILDPALWSMVAGFIPLAAKLGIAVDASTNLADLDEATLSRLNAANRGQSSAPLELRAARLLGARGPGPARLSRVGRAVHPRRPGRRDPLPDAAGGGGRRHPLGVGAEGDGRALLPKDADPVHPRRGGGRPLRDDEPLAPEPPHARLVRCGAGGGVIN